MYELKEKVCFFLIYICYKIKKKLYHNSYIYVQYTFMLALKHFDQLQDNLREPSNNMSRLDENRRCFITTVAQK